MSPMSCPRMKELTAVLKVGCLPSAWDKSLCSHVESCSECSDYILVFQSLHAARAETMNTLPPVTPGVIWWRAELRRRKEAFELLCKPTSIIGRLALSSTLVFAAVLLAWQIRQVDHWLKWISDLPTSNTFHLESLWSVTSTLSVLVPLSMIGILALLGAFALYLATDKS